MMNNYRPFFKQYVYHSKDLNECMYKTKDVFKYDNICICTQGNGGRKNFSCLMAKGLTDLNYNEAGTLCYPLYNYVENNDFNLFYNEGKRIKEYNISDYAIKKFGEKYSVTISPEDIFYYVYGILHSKDYTSKFEIDLKKSLPYIPMIESYEDFNTFSRAGKQLADLHLNYEKVEPYSKCKILVYPDANYNVTKMKFGKNKNKSIIEFNDKITISNIPEKAYEYIVSGKSAIEWIMDRYSITTDTKSEITNDPNDWCKENNDDMYIYNLLLKIINVSIKTVDIVNSLPRIDFG